jgi:hypothetical protein
MKDDLAQAIQALSKSGPVDSHAELTGIGRRQVII